MGERYQTVRCKNLGTGRFVDVGECGVRQAMQFESCTLPDCPIKAGVLRITAGAWSACSAPCTRAADSSPPQQTRCGNAAL